MILQQRSKHSYNLQLYFYTYVGDGNIINIFSTTESEYITFFTLSINIMSVLETYTVASIIVMIYCLFYMEYISHHKVYKIKK